MWNRFWKILAHIETVISLWKAIPFPSVAMVGTAWAAIVSHWSWPWVLLSGLTAFVLVIWGGLGIILINERRRPKAPSVFPSPPVSIVRDSSVITVSDTQGGPHVRVRLPVSNFSPEDVMVGIHEL